MALFEGNSITELPLKLTKNGLQYIAKQYQTIYDAYFGSDDDNSDKPLVMPYICNGAVAWTDNVWFLDASAPDNYQATYFSILTLNGSEPLNTWFTEPVFDELYSDADADNSYISASSKARCKEIAVNNQNFITQFELKSGYDLPISVDTISESGLDILVKYTNYPSFWEESIFNIGTKYRNNPSASKARVSKYTFNNGCISNGYFQFPLVTDREFYTNSNDQRFIDNIVNNNNYTTNTYTTNQGDTITYYYNDNSVIIPSGGVGLGLAGGVALGYVDIEKIFDDIILNLNTRPEFQSEPLPSFPTYDEIKYEDMGSFYITPIKQIDSLPLAPDVGDTVPDISDYLSVVGGAVTSFYNMVNDLGIGIMLVFTFLICLVINHLKKE